MAKKSKEVTSSGFGSNINDEEDRLVSKNGKVTIKKIGLNFNQRFNLYHSLIKMHALIFFLYLLGAYLFINLVFTGVYLAIGLECLQGRTGGNDFLQAFYFSSQTLTTVGYGGLHPTGNALSLIASFEAFLGLISFAVSTGLIYGRFSKPRAKMILSKVAVITPYKEITGLMARVANPKDSPLINANTKMLYSQIETIHGQKIRKFYTLDLEMEKISLFASSWTIVHPITKESPLYKISRTELKQKNVEIILLLSAHDESYNEDVHSRISYKASEIIENAKFSPIIKHVEGKHTVLCIDQIDRYELLT